MLFPRNAAFKNFSEFPHTFLEFFDFNIFLRTNYGATKCPVTKQGSSYPDHGSLCCEGFIRIPVGSTWPCRCLFANLEDQPFKERKVIGCIFSAVDPFTVAICLCLLKGPFQVLVSLRLT